MTSSDYRSNFLRWKSGRQGTGYEKMLLVVNPFWLPFDCYLLRYSTGTGVPQHADPVDSKRHYRLNVVLKNARSGGEFRCENCIYEGGRIKLFRPDRSPHSVTPVEEGVRYVFSLGWVLK